MKPQRQAIMTNLVLFLDFDGPLFPERAKALNCYSTPSELVPLNLPCWKMDTVAVNALNKLHQMKPFEIVVSSSWRTKLSKEHVCKLFQANGITPSLHEEWRTIDLSPAYISQGECSRAAEIDHWLRKNQAVNYFILDDSASGASLLCNPEGIELSNVFLATVEDGISYREYLRMLGFIRSL